MKTIKRKSWLRARNGGAFAAVGWLLISWLAGFLTAVSASSQTPEIREHFQVALSSAEVETGGTLLVQIDCRRMKACPNDLRFSFFDQSFPTFPHPTKGSAVQVGLVGIPLTATPGKTHLSLTWSTDGHRSSQKVFVEVRPGLYGEEHLKVDPRHVRPSPRDLERIRREQEELKRIYSSGSRLRLWRSGFQLPVQGEVNGPFGTRRVFNSELQSHHTGLDFRAQTGDPVKAASSGVVRLSKNLFYSGNAVIIDHGAGVFSSYSHLSQINVNVGNHIEKGQAVGLAGATSRPTGPHLHWGVKIHSISVDPLAFVRVVQQLGEG